MVEMVPAAQFLTLRLTLASSTEMGGDDLDGPGHAPTLLLCWAIYLSAILKFIILTVVIDCGLGQQARMSVAVLVSLRSTWG